MSRLIDAEELMRDIDEIYDTDKHKWSEDAEDILKEISEARTVDAEPIKHGKWLTQEYMYGLEDHEDKWVERLAEYGDRAYCSVCGGLAGLDGGEESALTPYCPHCGAKMDEMRGEEDEIN